jgi:uncharacterized protein RhaS with RHS repeats
LSLPFFGNINCYDFGFRFYDPALGRFTCLDPIAESFYHVTPYNYAENDPVGSIDLWGLQKVKSYDIPSKSQIEIGNLCCNIATAQEVAIAKNPTV